MIVATYPTSQHECPEPQRGTLGSYPVDVCVYSQLAGSQQFSNTSLYPIELLVVSATVLLDGTPLYITGELYAPLVPEDIEALIKMMQSLKF
jgi:hypothetical protein